MENQVRTECPIARMLSWLRSRGIDIIASGHESMAPMAPGELDIVSRFHRIPAGDQRPHCRPLDPASLSLLPVGCGLDACAVQGLTQKGAPRFHLNYVPRHLRVTSF
jgi:hypothetical protein